METKAAPDARASAEAMARRLVSALAGRSIVLVGLMGAGKTTVGRRLAQRLGLPFLDADVEIEKAAAQTIPEIFAEHGEAYFRDGERRVISRILTEGPLVLATGGGAFMNEATRHRIAERGVSIWLNADLATLMSRVRRKSNRPLLNNPDPEGTMRRLIDERYPVYAGADLTVYSGDGSHDSVVEDIVAVLQTHLCGSTAGDDEGPAA
jgi:shikimate kinase